MRGFLDTWGILVAKMFDLGVKWGIFEEQKCDFHINVGFSKRKGVIFASMGDLRRENARFSG